MLTYAAAGVGCPARRRGRAAARASGIAVKPAVKLVVTLVVKPLRRRRAAARASGALLMLYLCFTYALLDFTHVLLR
jgi:hypothetical protein